MGAYPHRLWNHAGVIPACNGTTIDTVGETAVLHGRICGLCYRCPNDPRTSAATVPPSFIPFPCAPCDGWTEERQCGFLAQLYITGSVTAAAGAVGMTPQSAYRLRARAAAMGFASAWDRVLTPPGSGHGSGLREDFRKVTNQTLFQRLETGLIQPVIYQRRMTAIRRKPDNSALFRLLRRTDRLVEPDCV